MFAHQNQQIPFQHPIVRPTTSPWVVVTWVAAVVLVVAALIGTTMYSLATMVRIYRNTVMSQVEPAWGRGVKPNHVPAMPDTSSSEPTSAIKDANSIPDMKHATGVISSSFSADRTRVVTASADGIVQVWSAATGLAIGEPMQDDDQLHMASFSPDGTRIVTASNAGTARVWDAKTSLPIGKLIRHEGKVVSAAFSPDGKRVVTASVDKTARIWDAATGKPLTEPMRHDEEVKSAAFNRDGTRVLTVTDSIFHGEAWVWDAETGRPVARLGEFLQVMGHWQNSWADATGGQIESAWAITSARFSPDGTRVLTTSLDFFRADADVRVWDAGTGKEVGEPIRHPTLVDSAAFSPDGKRIITTGSDKTNRIWDATTGKPLGAPK